MIYSNLLLIVDKNILTKAYSFVSLQKKKLRYVRTTKTELGEI